MKVTQTRRSRIAELDEDDIQFGRLFSDHMLVCDHVNGAWQPPEIKPYGNWQMAPASSVFHYGQAVFEGLKAYRDANDSIFLFRPGENAARLNRSAVRLQMPVLPSEIFMEGLKTLLKLDSDWVPHRFGHSLYIRPFVIATQAQLRVNPSESYRFCVICSPAGAYYEKPLKVIIAQKYSRAASGGTGYIKAAGNYAGALYPTALAVQAGYDQVIWTDADSHTYVEEAGTMNVFFRLGDTLVTPPIDDRILDGVTRRSIIELTEREGIAVEQRRLAVDEIAAAHREGRLREAFGCGTAAVVSTISTLHCNGSDIHLPDLGDESYGARMKAKILDIQYNRAADPFGWRVKVT
ncbi:MAG: branched-chain amino acid aminotransferase [Flavobacteriales bacterium]